MKALCVIVSLCFIACEVNSATKGSTIDNLTKNVMMIAGRSRSDTSRFLTGTGFLVQCKSGFPHELLFVSCSHVLDSLGEKSATLFGRRIDSGVYKETRRAIRLNKIGTNKLSYDIGAIGLSRTDLEGLDYYWLVKESFANDQDIELFNNQVIQQMFFIGYPELKRDHFNGLPYKRQCNFATVPQTPLKAYPVLYIDGPVFHGNSGSPVHALFDRNTIPLTSDVRVVGMIFGIDADTLRFQIHPKKVPSENNSIPAENTSPITDSAITAALDHYFRTTKLEGAIERNFGIAVAINASYLTEYFKDCGCF